MPNLIRSKQKNWQLHFSNMFFIVGIQTGYADKVQTFLLCGQGGMGLFKVNSHGFDQSYGVSHCLLLSTAASWFHHGPLSPVLDSVSLNVVHWVLGSMDASGIRQWYTLLMKALWSILVCECWLFHPHELTLPRYSEWGFNHSSPSVWAWEAPLTDRDPSLIVVLREWWPPSVPLGRCPPCHRHVLLSSPELHVQ